MYFRFPTVEECNFDRQFLFDEYVAISHRFDLKLSRGFWGTREHCKFYNGNTGTKENKIREQGNTKYMGEQGNKAPFLEYIQVLQWPNVL